jgi:hypothetical protein
MTSISRRHVGKIFSDIYTLFMVWALRGLGALAVLFTLSLLVFASLRSLEMSILAMITGIGNSYMLVVGIITGIYMIHYYIRQGVTRRSFFLGALLAGAAASGSVQVIGALLNLISYGVESFLPFSAGRHLTSYPMGRGGYPEVMSISTLISAIHFFMGWIIGFSFYRYKASGGAACILLGILILGGVSLVWNQPGLITVNGLVIRFPQEMLSLGMMVLITCVIAVGLIAVLYGMIRRSPIRVE